MNNRIDRRADHTMTSPMANPFRASGVSPRQTSRSGRSLAKLRFVLTAGPLADKGTTYMAQAVPSGSVRRLCHPRAAFDPCNAAAAGSAVGAFHLNVAAAESLGKFGVEELLELRDTHFCNSHVPPLPSLGAAYYIRFILLPGDIVDTSWICR